MKFGEFVCDDAIRTDLVAGEKKGVIREMVQLLQDSGQIRRESLEAIVEVVLRREELGSTGLGLGVAIPYAKHCGVERTVAAVGVSQIGLDFDSVDGGTVDVFFLVISPSDQPSTHLSALECIAHRIRTGDFCCFLRQAKTVDEISYLLRESDEEL